MKVIHALLVCVAVSGAATHRGRVLFGGLPVPGATVSAACGQDTRAVITNMAGHYVIEADEACTINVEMQVFAPQGRAVTGPSELEWELKVQPTVKAVTGPARVSRTTAETPSAPPPAEFATQTADGLLINGSVSNGAASPFALFPAFGNNRRGQRSLYNGSLGFIGNHSIFDARPYSLTGQETPKPNFSRYQGLISAGGPLSRRRGPFVTANYQWTRNRSATTQTALVPTALERAGLFSRPITDPAAGTPFRENRIPASLLSPQAQALLELYPLPNYEGSGRYNYQVPVVTGLHQDDLQLRATKQVRRDQVFGNFAWQSTRTDDPGLLGYLETGAVGGFNSGFGYRHSLSPRTFWTVRAELSRLHTDLTPWFAGRSNVSAAAGIQGNNQEPVNWGPPSLRFSGGIAPLSLNQYTRNRNQTAGVSADMFFSRGRHNVMTGGAFRRQQFNVLSQQDPRGTLSFIGTTTGSDLASFLLGIADASSIAWGNADKYLRASIAEGFINDDFRVSSGLTINAGVRYEYWSPVTERYGRLVNLSVGQGFSTALPNTSLLPRPDRNNFSPRIGVSWRPLPVSSLVVRAGYGIYYDTGVYQPIASLMSQQAPFSRSLRAAGPLSLAAPFDAIASTTQQTTFGVDPNFRVGYSQNWQVSLASDFPGALNATLTYLGGKGTRAQQHFLPNTFPEYSVDPFGFTYLTSNGNSSRHAGRVQLRRRLRNGLSGQLEYTYSKSIDNAALGGRREGGLLIAQNWLDLSAERARSNFDQRHLLTAAFEYTTSARHKLLRDWRVGSQLSAASGLPLTPVFPQVLAGTGITTSMRPDFTGAPLYDAPAGMYLNPAAVAPPAPGTWGNAGRNSINGPSQFVVNASFGRSFRSAERVSFDTRIDVANALNNVNYTTWGVVAGNPLFGVPVAANAMRSVQLSIRTRF